MHKVKHSVHKIGASSDETIIHTLLQTPTYHEVNQKLEMPNDIEIAIIYGVGK